MCGVSHVADETLRVCEVVEAAMAEAKSVHSEVASKVVSLLAHATANTAHIVEVLSGCVQEVAAHSEAQALRVAELVTQRLEKEIEVATTSVVMTTTINTHMTVEGMRRDI